MTDWVKACSTDSIGQGEMFSFDYNEKKLLLTNMNGKIFATDRTCTHADADLSTGFLTENGLTCPLHLSVFNMDDGKPQILLLKTHYKLTEQKYKIIIS